MGKFLEVLQRHEVKDIDTGSLYVRTMISFREDIKINVASFHLSKTGCEKLLGDIVPHPNSLSIPKLRASMLEH